MNTKINSQKISSIIFDIGVVCLLTLTILVTFIIIKKNDFGYFQTGINTYIVDKNVLLKIKKSSYDELKKGDRIYYYIKNGDKYSVTSDIITFKGIAKDETVYVVKNSPNETILSERIIGKLDKSSRELGVLFNILTSNKGYFIFLIVPLMLLTIYKLYNTIDLPKRNVESPIKLKPPIKLSSENIDSINQAKTF